MIKSRPILSLEYENFMFKFKYSEKATKFCLQYIQSKVDNCR